MATYTVIEHMRLDDYGVIQTLEDTEIGVGQTITLSGLGHGLNGAHTVFAVPTFLFIGVDQEGDLLYDYDVIVLNQLLFYDAGDDLERGAAIPTGTLTWSITCTWTTSALVTEFLGIAAATANDTAYIATCVSASNAYCFRARQQAGYHDAPGTAPDASAQLGATLYAASLYRERGSVDSFASFSDMTVNQPTGLTMGRIKQLLGIRRSQVA
jgi:hypothetical protein